ncbi:Leukocyte elastase inhibitor [Halotydeus destructor]|nr:Leukocyte elastase inhibitor [Halotydeus destructor]
MEKDPKATLESNELARWINEFGNDFLKEVASDTANVCFSSASITTAFAMLLAGAEGNTADQLMKGLKIDHVSDIHGHFKSLMKILEPRELSYSHYELVMNNVLMISKRMPVTEKFRKILDLQYNTAIDYVDFLKDSATATSDINDWISMKTRGHVKKQVYEVRPDTRFIIINVIYFKGLWELEFDPRLTVKAAFYSQGERLINYMYRECYFRAYRDKKKDITAMELPYVGNASMIVIMPNQTAGLAHLIATSSPEDYVHVSQTVMNTPVQEAFIYIPKFSIEAEYDLKPILTKMGVEDLFDSLTSDLSGVNGGSDLYVNMAMHKAAVVVDEEGTEAAAVTIEVSQEEPIFTPDARVYRVNRPFLFFIRDHVSGINLFAGSITKL